ncbi:membrane protein (plasmid) [Ralstonia solanacearum]|nr:membrane protein [Ralstonia solanacearum]
MGPISSRMVDTHAWWLSPRSGQFGTLKSRLAVLPRSPHELPGETAAARPPIDFP